MTAGKKGNDSQPRIGDLEALKGFGNVTIVDSVSGRIDAMPFAVRAVDEVAVLPSTIRFAAKDGHSVATGLIRVQRKEARRSPSIGARLSNATSLGSK